MEKSRFESNPESNGETNFFTILEDKEGRDEFLEIFDKISSDALKAGKKITVEVKVEK